MKKFIFSLVCMTSIIMAQGQLSHEILGNGQVKFNVVLPSGQAWVEMFVRHGNSLEQHISGPIMASAIINGDGTSTYSVIGCGYTNGEIIQYRAYSYMPQSPGVFTPGPEEMKWITCYYTNTFITADATYQLGPQVENGVNVNYQVYYRTAQDYYYPAPRHYGVMYAPVPNLSEPLLLNDADMVNIYVQNCNSSAWENTNTTLYNVVPRNPVESIDQSQMLFNYTLNQNRPTSPWGTISTTYQCGWVDGYTHDTSGKMYPVPVGGTLTFVYVVKHFQ